MASSLWQYGTGLAQSALKRVITTVACGDGLFRSLLNRIITTVAWLLADWFGWRAALAVYPPMLRNKVAIVTGANAGLGLETTKALLQQGATVIMGCRSLEKGQAAVREILGDPRNQGEVGNAGSRLKLMQLDFDDFDCIRRFVADFHKLNLPLSLLVNNAGVHLMEYKHVDGGFERTIASNYFGPFYLTQLLLDDLKASAPARVVSMASVGEAMGWRHMLADGIPWDDLPGRQLSDSGERPYTLYKTYLMMANTRELARRLEGTGVDVIAVHPGATDSSWYKKADPQRYTFSWIIHAVCSVATWVGVGQPTACGAISMIYASIAPELTGSSSSPKSHGIIDTINRSLFGGRLIYYGPAYLANILGGPINFLNTTQCWVVNPWVYNRAACERLYDMTLDLITEVKGGPRASSNTSTNTLQAQRPRLPAASDAVSTGSAAPAESAGVGSGGGVGYADVVHGGLKQRQQAAAGSAAPIGVEDVNTLLSAAALPARGS